MFFHFGSCFCGAESQIHFQCQNDVAQSYAKLLQSSKANIIIYSFRKELLSVNRLSSECIPRELNVNGLIDGLNNGNSQKTSVWFTSLCPGPRYLVCCMQFCLNAHPSWNRKSSRLFIRHQRTTCMSVSRTLPFCGENAQRPSVSNATPPNQNQKRSISSVGAYIL